MGGGGLGNYAPAEFSDDTQMGAVIAKLSANSADRTRAHALDAIADGFLRWARQDATDIGVQTSSVLRSGPIQ